MADDNKTTNATSTAKPAAAEPTKAAAPAEAKPAAKAPAKPRTVKAPTIRRPAVRRTAVKAAAPADAAKEISDAWKDTGEEVAKAFDSFSDSIKSVLYNAEATAEDVANNIYEYMRKALVDSMFVEQVQPQIKAWYDKYTEFMADGAIDSVERGVLDEMLKEIQDAGIEIVDAANKLFPSLDTGAQKRTEEAAQEAENAKNAAEQEWESFSDDILNSLYDIEATAEDISDNMGEYMRKALIKA